MNKKDKDKIKQLDDAVDNILESLIGLRRYEAISLLEEIKFDIMLNGGPVKLDGKIGIIKKGDDNIVSR